MTVYCIELPTPYKIFWPTDNRKVWINIVKMEFILSIARPVVNATWVQLEGCFEPGLGAFHVIQVSKFKFCATPPRKLPLDWSFAYLTQKHRIINYFQYIDDILLIFDPNHTDIQTILTNFNSIHPKLHFTAEIEQNNTLNYLDISIHKTQNNIKTSIHRKPTFTHTSNHPTQQKYTTVRSYTTD